MVAYKESTTKSFEKLMVSLTNSVNNLYLISCFLEEEVRKDELKWKKIQMFVICAENISSYG